MQARNMVRDEGELVFDLWCSDNFVILNFVLVPSHSGPLVHRVLQEPRNRRSGSQPVSRCALPLHTYCRRFAAQLQMIEVITKLSLVPAGTRNASIRSKIPLIGITIAESQNSDKLQVFILFKTLITTKR